LGLKSLQPTLSVDLTYSKVMEELILDPVYRGLV
jgi:hypothetical protein